MDAPVNGCWTFQWIDVIEWPLEDMKFPLECTVRGLVVLKLRTRVILRRCIETVWFLLTHIGDKHFRSLWYGHVLSRAQKFICFRCARWCGDGRWLDCSSEPSPELRITEVSTTFCQYSNENSWSTVRLLKRACDAALGGTCHFQRILAQLGYCWVVAACFQNQHAENLMCSDHLNSKGRRFFLGRRLYRWKTPLLGLLHGHLGGQQIKKTTCQWMLVALLPA